MQPPHAAHMSVPPAPPTASQDVYTKISDMVKRTVAEDAARGVPEAAALLAHTEVDRKLVKQTVMTSVYGVTFVGARTQVCVRACVRACVRVRACACVCVRACASPGGWRVHCFCTRTHAGSSLCLARRLADLALCGLRSADWQPAAGARV